MKTSKIYLEAVKNIPPEVCKETDYSFGISDKLAQILTERSMTQKQFAKMMKKSEAEVSVWLSGQHNFTLRTLAKIAVVLDEDLISIAK